MDNRSKILQVALALFSARGYDGVGVQEIVDKAGITKPTLYHYFNSKEGLFNSLMEEYFGRFVAQFREAADYQQDLTLTLTRLLKVSVDFFLANPVFFRLQAGLLAAAPESPACRMTATYFDALHSQLETLFRQATREHGNMKGRHPLYAATFLGFINTCANQVIAGKLEKNEHALYRALHQFMHGIFS